MLQIRVTLLTCVLLGITAAESVKPRDSLELSCVDRNYIGVLAETRERKTIPLSGHSKPANEGHFKTGQRE